MSNPVNEQIRIENISFSYQSHSILKNVHIHMKRGELIAIVGPNGGGKTTFIKLLLGLLKPHSGFISFFGQSFKEYQRKIAYVPQRSETQLAYPVTVEDVIQMGLIGMKKSKTEKKEAVNSILEKVHLEKKKHSLFHQISGGEMQRCLIGRALISEPQVLIMDEPTTGVDMMIEQELYQLFGSLKGSTTTIIVSHDLDFVYKEVDSVICINQEAHIHPIKELDEASLQKHVYTNYKRVDHSTNVEVTSHE